MLGFDYSQHYADVVRRTPWTIGLPESWGDYFNESGIPPSVYNEDRASQRRVVRTVGLLRFEKPLPALERPDGFLGVYTRDFSKNTVGLVSPLQVYPGEMVRLVLPTFWLHLDIVRCVRKTATCFETGAKLIERHDPHRRAFECGVRSDEG